jgi:acetylornithine deacetylase
MVQPSSEELDNLYHQGLGILSEMITIQSFSKEEDKVADLISKVLLQENMANYRHINNVYSVSKFFDVKKPTIFLNSHIDTVKPNPSYTNDPLDPKIEDGKLFGLGSNDAGGPLISLMMSYLHLGKLDLKYNIVFIASAEEEISGKAGVEALFKDDTFLQKVGLKEGDFAIVGEPTLMNMAIAERGLMVLDAVNYGVAGHAAREEGSSALYKTVDDITQLKNHTFQKVSSLLGPVKASATVIHTDNKAHNVIPDICNWVIDCRVNELYTFQEVLDELSSLLDAKLTPRSMRLKSTIIPIDHPIVQSGIQLGKTFYGSPTTSDKALLPIQALKMGPGDSARSHTADEFIYLDELRQGIKDYISIILNIASKN